MHNNLFELSCPNEDPFLYFISGKNLSNQMNSSHIHFVDNVLCYIVAGAELIVFQGKLKN